MENLVMSKVEFFGVTSKAAILLFSVGALTACAGIKQQIEATKARGTIDAGGYTWEIPQESEGGVTVRANGLPPRQAATDAASIVCKKYGRVAQFVKQDGSLILGFQQFEFNCNK
jgi:hypothetical protein